MGHDDLKLLLTNFTPNIRKVLWKIIKHTIEIIYFKIIFN